MAVSGPKTDIWLVKTVAVLLLPICFIFLYTLFSRKGDDNWPAIIAGISCCIGLAAIDFYYVTENIIADIYLVDGFVQLAFLIGWTTIIIKQFATG
jgi:hypothetical protein